jgi:hypothetical protein
VFDRVEQASFVEQMLNNPNDVSRYLECMVRLHMSIHAHGAIQFAGLKVRLAANIAATRLLDERREQDLLGRIADMPDGDRLCHGDFHPMNILGELSQPVIIDWPDARRGDSAADVCRSCLLMKLHAAEIATPISTRTAEPVVWPARPCSAGCRTWGEARRRCPERARRLAENRRLVLTQLSPHQRDSIPGLKLPATRTARVASLQFERPLGSRAPVRHNAGMLQHRVSKQTLRWRDCRPLECQLRTRARPRGHPRRPDWS